VPPLARFHIVLVLHDALPRQSAVLSELCVKTKQDVRLHEARTNQKHDIKRTVDGIFNDSEAKANLVGLYSVLLRVDRRINPHLYADKKRDEHHD